MSVLRAILTWSSQASVASHLTLTWRSEASPLAQADPLRQAYSTCLRGQLSSNVNHLIYAPTECSMNWELNHHNPAVAAAFTAYRGFVLNIATHYAGSRLMEHLDLSSLGDDLHLAISDDFPEFITTIRTVGDLRNYISSGEYSQLCSRQATVQLCTAFELFFDTISEIYGISDSSLNVVNATYNVASASPITLGNRAIKQIRKLHDQLSIQSVLNNDEVLVKLTAIVEARNCIVHSAGVVPDANKVLRLSAYALRHNIGDQLHLPNNLLDDFLHYMGIHIMAFVKRLP